jgi:cell division protein FtsA
MKQSEFIAALDLGTSKITAMVGRKNEQNEISVIAVEKEDSETCIRRACVYNVEKTADKITKLLKKLNAKLPSEIERIYVGIGGQSLRSEVHTVKRSVPTGIVTDQLIQSLFSECKKYKPEFVEVLDIVEPEYYLDGRPEMNPIGVQCSKIEAKFKLVLGRPSLKRTLQKSIKEKANIEIAGYIVAPIATAMATLTHTEKELGCALIELGAGITYLSIYKNKSLKFLISIPLGGNVITKDICNLNVLENEAEELKIHYGSALIDLDNEKAQPAQLADGSHRIREIELSKLNNIIEARMDEILANISHQIELSGFGDALGAGIIITGGGAALNNLSESVKSKLGYEVRIASVKKSLVNSAEIGGDYGNVQAVGLLAMGKNNCAKIIEVKQETLVEQSLFKDEEVEVVQIKQSNPTIQQQESKEKGFFKRMKKNFDGFSKKLFDEE